MTIKGLKEALAKKKQQNQPDAQTSEQDDIKITATRPVRIAANRPQKKVTGRGR